MLDRNTVIQYFVRVCCLVRHCTDCEVNCDGLQNLNIKFTFHILTSYYDRCLERQLTKLKDVPHAINKLLNTDILVQERQKWTLGDFLHIYRISF